MLRIGFSFAQSLQTLGGLGMILALNGRLALISLTGLAVSGLVAAVNGAFARWLSEQVQDKLAEANSVGVRSRVCRAALDDITTNTI